MTEEIKIDGVNVAGCEHHLSTGYCQLQMIFQGMVLKLPFGKHLECNLCDKDCYYKQLKRLQAENEELKHRCEVYHKCDEMIKNTYGQAHKEAMRLTKENEQLKEEISIAKENYGLEMEFQMRYRETLEEIRELVKGYKNSEGIIRQTTTEYLIQNKINEVLR